MNWITIQSEKITTGDGVCIILFGKSPWGPLCLKAYRFKNRLQIKIWPTKYVVLYMYNIIYLKKEKNEWAAFDCRRGHHNYPYRKGWRRGGGGDVKHTTPNTQTCMHLCNATCVNTVTRLVATGNPCLSSELWYIILSIFTSTKVVVLFKALTLLSFFLFVCLFVKRREDAGTPAPTSQTLTHGCLSEEMSRWAAWWRSADVWAWLEMLELSCWQLWRGSRTFPCQLPVKCLCCQLNHLLL